MLVGGDELLHSVRCNNNYYNVDSLGTWIDWSAQGSAFWTFTQRLLKFRAAHPALRPEHWIEPNQVSWRDGTGTTIGGAYMDDASKPVLAWRLDGPALGDQTIYVVYNRGGQPTRITLPPAPSGLAWYRAGDTSAWMEAQNNFHLPGDEYRMNQTQYDLGARALAIFLAR